ncbi:MAG TPA: hypothetical protein VFA59_07000 [Vicinamibacterales bacterium]|nr:hypothetical protein [Vicinamibacterales bacterium]
MKKICIGVTLLIATSCGGGSGSNPTSPSTPPTATPTVNNACTNSTNCPSQPAGINIFITASIQSGATGSATFTFAGQTFTTTASRDYLFNNVAAGDYDVTGQFTGLTSFSIGARRAPNVVNTGGGPQPGSLQSLEGPLPTPFPSSAASCSMNYQDFGARPTTVDTFHMKFTVNASLAVGSTC